MAVEEPIVNIYLTNPPTEYCQARYTVKQKPSKCRTKGKYMFCLPGEKQGYITCGTHLKALCDLSSLGMDSQPMKPLPKNGKLLGYGDYENMEEQQCQALITAASGKEPPERCSSCKTFAFQSEQHDCILFLCKKHFSWIDNAYDHKSYIVHETPSEQQDASQLLDEQEVEQQISNENDEAHFDPANKANSEDFMETNVAEDADKLSLLTNGENGYTEANGIGEDSYSVEENNDMALQTSKTQSSSQQTSLSEHRNQSSNMNGKQTETQVSRNEQTEGNIYSSVESHSDVSVSEQREDEQEAKKNNSTSGSHSHTEDVASEPKQAEEERQEQKTEQKEPREVNSAPETKRVPPPPPKPQHFKPEEKSVKSKQKAAEGGCCVIS